MSTTPIPKMPISDEVRTLLEAWKTAFRGMVSDGWDPVDLSEAMLAVAVRVKVELDGPPLVSRMLALKAAELIGEAAVAGTQPTTGVH